MSFNEEKASSAKQWLILGAVFLTIVFINSILETFFEIELDYTLRSLFGAIFAVGGIFFLIIGLFKVIAEHFKK